MGIVQQFRFSYNKSELILLLSNLGYNKQNLLYIKKNSNMIIELAIEDYGLYVHRSGEYLSELGLLVESLGMITSEMIVTDA